MIQSKLLILATSILLTSSVFAQSTFDISAGSSNSDYFFSTLAYRKQLANSLRIGIEVQAGAVRYRFIEAKPIREGYFTSVSVPMLIRLYERDKVRLDIYFRLGLRFQGVIDPDGNDKRDQKLTSTAFNAEPGLVITIPIHDRLMLHSGVTIPNVFELRPSFLYENNVSAILGGLAYQTSRKHVLFLKGLAGPAVGADGDSQKFLWSIQAGIRVPIGQSSNALVLEPSF